MGPACCKADAAGARQDRPKLAALRSCMYDEIEEKRGVQLCLLGSGTEPAPCHGASRLDCVEAVAEYFPMHTVSVQTFMGLQAMQSFGELRHRGVLHVLPQDAVTHFISHEWLGFSHPDPNGEQIRRMQSVFQAAMDQRVTDLFEPSDWKAFSEKVSTSSTGMYRASEASWRTDKGALTEAGFGQHVAQGEVWLDYGCIPQDVDSKNLVEQDVLQRRAIRSIPAYLERSDYFWVLTPTARHADKGTWCSFTTWRSRGWCRLEEWGNFLSTTSCAPLIITNAPKLSTIGMFDFMMSSQGKPSMAPCAGHFTCCQLQHEKVLPSGAKRALPCDKAFVLPVLMQLFYAKQRHTKAEPKMKLLFLSLCTLVEPMIFGGAAGAPVRSAQELEKETISEFLDRFGMGSVREVAPPGFGAWQFATATQHFPMLRRLRSDPEAMAAYTPPQHNREAMSLVDCCAMQGHVKVLQELMAMGLITDCDIDLPYGANAITPLDRAAKYGFPEMVRFLLGMRACVNWRRKCGATPLHGAAQAGHASCCRVLLEHCADVNPVDNLGRLPLHLAADPLTFYGAGEGKAEALQVLLQYRADASLRDAQGRTAFEVACAAFFHDADDAFLVLEDV